MKEKIKEFIAFVKLSRSVNLFIILFLLIAMPLTVLMVKKSQDIRQRAETNNNIPSSQITNISCDGGIIGWANDKDGCSKPIGVHVYVDGQFWEPKSKFISSVLAAVPDSGIESSCDGNQDHGFAIRIPDILLDGKSHKINLYAIDYPDPINSQSIKDKNGTDTFSLTCDSNLVNSNFPANDFPAIISVDAAKSTGNVSPLLFGVATAPNYSGLSVETRSSGLLYYNDINNKTVRPPFFATMKNMNPTFIRAQFSHDVHWTNSIGDYNLRPQKYGNVLPDYCYTCTDTKKIGIDEFLTYVEKLGSTPILMVNSANNELDTNLYPIPTGSISNNPIATAREVAAEVAYTNGSVGNLTKIGTDGNSNDENGTDWQDIDYWAKQRVQNGHSAPYNVKYWEFGNEDFAEVPGMGGVKYAQRYMEYKKQMKNIDPSIQLGALTQNNDGNSQWNKDLFKTVYAAGDKIDYLINHDYPLGDIQYAKMYNGWWIEGDINLSANLNFLQTYTIDVLSDAPPSQTSTLRVCWDILLETCKGTPDDKHYKDITINGSYNLQRKEFTSEVLNEGTHHYIFYIKSTFSFVELSNDIFINSKRYKIVPEKEMFEVKMGELENSLTNLYNLRHSFIYVLEQIGIANAVVPPIAVTEYDPYYSNASVHSDLTGALSTFGILDRYLWGKLDMANFYVANVNGRTGNVNDDTDWYTAIGFSTSGPDQFWPNPQFYPLQLFSRHFGSNMVQNYVSLPVFEAKHLEYRGKGIPVLSAQTSTNQTGDKLYIAVINKSYDQNITTQVNLEHFSPSSNGFVWTLNSSEVTDRSIDTKDPQKKLRIVPSSISNISNSFSYTFPAHSVTVIEIPSANNYQQSQIQIQAKSNPSSTGVWPRMLLWVNGDPRAEWVTSGSVQTYSATIPKVNPGDEVEIVYANQADSNQTLTIETFTIDGTVINPSNSGFGVMFNPGLLYGAIDSDNIQPGINIITENGALIYRLPDPVLTPTPTNTLVPTSTNIPVPTNTPVPTPTPTPISVPDGQFKGEYWTNVSSFTSIPTSTPTLTRTDIKVDFDWGTGSPDLKISKDKFIARWTVKNTFQAGTYTFSVRVDDGLRLYVDNVKILDKWMVQSPTSYTVDYVIPTGIHTITMEYYENDGGAMAKLGYYLNGTVLTTAYRAEYFTNVSTFEFPVGAPKHSRSDTSINFNWGTGSPDYRISKDRFMARWTKKASFSSSKTYKFTITTDDGVRLYIDGVKILDKWSTPGLYTYTVSKYLTSDYHVIMMEYYENTGNAVAKMSYL